MSGYGCTSCAGAMPVPGLRGVVMEPVRGIVMEPVGDPATQTAGLFVGASGMVGGALSGALVGGLAGASWRAAGTGALLASGVQGAFAGIGLMMLPETRVGGGVLIGLAATALLWGGSRAVVDMGRRRRG